MSNKSERRGIILLAILTIPFLFYLPSTIILLVATENSRVNSCDQPRVLFAFAVTWYKSL